MVSLPSSVYVGDPAETVGDALGTVDDAAERQSERQRETLSAAGTTLASFGGSYKEAGEAAAQGDGLAAMNRVGEGVLNLTTGGDAEGFREDYREENPVDEYRQSAEESLEEGGFWGTAGAANEVLKTGIDTGVDSPRGLNLQETVVGASGADSEEELAAGAQDRHEQWMDARSKPAEALPDWMPGSEGSTTANVAGTGFDWFVQFPAEAVYTTATGVDPASGETNARGEPIDLLDVALIGGGKAIKGASRGAGALRGSRLTGSTDETLRGVSASRADEASSSGITSALGGTAVAAAGAIGGPRAARGMLRLGKGVGNALRRGSTVTDDAVPQAGRAVDQRSIGVSEDALQQRGVDEALQAFDGTPSAGATPSSGATNIDNVVGNVGSGVDDALEGAGRTVSEVPGGSAMRLSNRIEDTLSNVRGRVGAGSVEEVAEQTGRAARSSADELGQNAGSRLLGGFGSAVDDAASAARRGLDDAQTRLTRSFDEASETASRAGTSLEDGLNANRLDEASGLGARVRAAPSRAWQRVSNWYANAGRGTRFMVQGAAGVLGLSALNDITGFSDWVAENVLNPAAGPTSEPSEVQGSMDHPGEVEQGESFTADWTVGSKGGESRSGRLVFALEVDGELAPLAEANFSVGPEESTSGTFEVPSGWGGVDPGRYNSYALVQMGGEVAGSIDDSALKVTEATGNTEQDGDWSDPEVVRELQYGWYLLSQARVNADEMRFLVAGNREDGTTIYLHPDGRGREEAHTFPTVERAAEAYQEWVQRHEAGSTRAGETPSERAGRPSSGQVKSDAAAADSGARGLLNRTVSFARRNPLLFAGMSAAALAGGYYLYKHGYFSGVKRQVRRLPFV